MSFKEYIKNYTITLIICIITFFILKNLYVNTGLCFITSIIVGGGINFYLHYRDAFKK